MNHEIFHVVRNLSRIEGGRGPLSSKDFETLSRFTRNNKSRTTQGKTYYQHALDTYGKEPMYQKGGKVDVEAIQDEADAHAYEDWSKGIKNTSVSNNIFTSLQNFFLDIINSLKGQGFGSVDSVFKKIDDLSPDTAAPGKVPDQKQNLTDKVQIKLIAEIDKASFKVSAEAQEAAKLKASDKRIYVTKPKFSVSPEAINKLPKRMAIRNKSVFNYISRMTDKTNKKTPNLEETIFELQNLTDFDNDPKHNFGITLKKYLFMARTAFVNDLDYVTKMQREVTEEFGNNFADTAAEAAVQMAKNHNAILSNSLTIGVPKYNSATSQVEDDRKGFTFNDSITANINGEEVEINGLIDILSPVIEGLNNKTPEYREIAEALQLSDSDIQSLENGENVNIEDAFYGYFIARRSIELYERTLGSVVSEAQKYKEVIDNILLNRVPNYGQNVNLNEEILRDLRIEFPQGSQFELDSSLEESLVNLMAREAKEELLPGQFNSDFSELMQNYAEKVASAKVLGPIEEHRNMVNTFDGFEVFNVTAQKYDAFNKGMIDYMVNTGLISQNEASLYRQTSSYIPFLREFDMSSNIEIEPGLKDISQVVKSVEGVGKEINIKPLKKIKGPGTVYRITIDGVPQGRGFTDLGQAERAYREYQKDGAKYGIAVTETIGIEKGGAPLGGMFNNISINLSNVIKAGMRNVALQRIVRDGLSLNTAKQVQLGRVTDAGVRIPKEGEAANVSVRVNGQEQQFYVHDPLLMEALKSIEDDQAAISQYPIMEKLMTMPANVLRDLVTREPGFMLANMFRDSLAAYVTSGRDITPILGTIKGYADAFKSDPSSQALLRAGIKGGFDFSITSDAKIPNEIEKLIKKEFPSRRSKTEKALRFTGLKQVWDGLGQATEYSDLATRVAVYNEVLANTGNQAQAIYEAQEILNFRRRGRYMKTLSAIIPFLNARIQGLDVLYRGFTGRAASTNAELTRADQKRAFMVRAGMLIALTGVIWAINAGDEDWESVDDVTQDNNWIILGKYIPFIPDDYNLKFPIPFEVGFIFKTIPERLLDFWFGNTTGEALVESGKRGLHESTAIQFPTTVGPLFEWMINYSFYQGRPLLNFSESQMYPASDVIRAGTSDLAVQASKLLGNAGIEVTPVEIDNLIRGYGGTAAHYVTSLVDSFISTGDELERPSKKFTDAPFISRFLMDNTEARGVTGDVFRLNNYYDKIARKLSRAEAGGNQNAISDLINGDLAHYYDLKPDILYLRKELQSINSQLKKLQTSVGSKEYKDEQRAALESARKYFTDMVQLVNRKVKESDQ